MLTMDVTSFFAHFHGFDEFFYKISFFLHDSSMQPFLTVIGKFFSFLGDGGILWVVLALALLLFKKTRKLGIIVAAGILFDVIAVNGILKIFIDRPRPWVQGDFYPPITRDYVQTYLVSIPGDSSFPSGHTASSFAAATALTLGLDKKKKFWGIIAIIVAVFIGASRIYACVHYPSDVFAGLIIGIILGVLGYVVANAIYKKIEKSKKPTMIRSIIIGEKWGI